MTRATQEELETKLDRKLDEILEWADRELGYEIVELVVTKLAFDASRLSAEERGRIADEVNECISGWYLTVELREPQHRLLRERDELEEQISRLGKPQLVRSRDPERP